MWGSVDEQDKPTAWVIPEGQIANQWFWMNGGGVVVPGPNHQSRLIVFLFQLAKGDKEGSVWNFKHIGNAMAIVDNVQQPAEKWMVRQVAVPYHVGTIPNSNSAPTRSSTAPAREVNWGVSAMLRQVHQGKDDRMYLYIYGVHTTATDDKQLMLARVPADQVERLDQWRFYSGDGQWSPRLSNAVRLADKVASELSVDEHIHQGRSTYIMVHSEPVFGRRIMVRTAPTPEGPWSKSRAVHTVDGLDSGKEYFTYAAKGHLHLSHKGELLVTYINNSNDFWEMAADAEIYRPRFVRIPLDQV